MREELRWLQRNQAGRMREALDANWQEVAWQHRRDPRRAVEICRRLQALLPGTSYAQNAAEYLREHTWPGFQD